MKLHRYTIRHLPITRPFARFGVFAHQHLKAHPAVGKYGLATAVLFSGAAMATNPVHFVPHFLWDGISYTIHGFGAAPFVERAFRIFEDLFSGPPHADEEKGGDK